jgi:hypothetical protein
LPPAPKRRIEARLEQVDHAARDRRIGDKRALHIVLAERNAGLAQVLGIGAQQCHLAPGQAPPPAPAVQAVVLQRARPQMLERLDEARPDRGEIDRRFVGGLDPQHLQRDVRPSGRLSWNGASLSTRRPRCVGERQDVGQRDRLAGMEQPDREAMRRHAGAPAEAHAELAPSSAACSGSMSSIACAASTLSR